MPESSNRPLRVFLCHASADKPAVRGLYTRLVSDGVDAWLDQEKLIPGQNWQVEIPKAVKNSDVVIVCISGKSVNKEGYVQKEIKFALDIADEKPEGTIFIIPARLEDCDTPDRLSMYHWVDLFSKDGYERLLRALTSRAEQIGATPPSKKAGLFSLPKATPKITLPEKIKKEPNQEPSKPRLNVNPKTLGIVFAGLFVVILLFLGIPKLMGQLQATNSEPAPTSTSTSLPKTITPTHTPSRTPTIMPTKTVTPTSAPPPVTIGGTKFALNKISQKNVEQLELLSTIDIGKTGYGVSSAYGSPSAGISPDGNLFVIAHAEAAITTKYSIQVWSILDGKMIHALEVPGILNKVFVDNDEIYLAVCNKVSYSDCSEGELFLIQTDNWELISKGKVFGQMLSLSEDRQMAAIARENYSRVPAQISIWDIPTSRLSKVDTGDKYKNISNAVFSPNSQFLAFNGTFLDSNEMKYKFFVRVIELSNPASATTLYQNDGNVCNNPCGLLSFSPDNTRVAVKPNPLDLKNQTTQIWQISDGTLLSEYTGSASSLAFSPDGTMLITAADQVDLWDVQNQASLKVVDEKADFVAFSADGMLIFTVSNESRSIKIWGVKKP
jgi:hypothetical protein